jgi:hypothetical protein
VRYAKPTDKRLVEELRAMTAKGGEYQPVKCWSPDGPSYWVSTAASAHDVAGSLVCDGMPEADYWPMVEARKQ